MSKDILPFPLSAYPTAAEISLSLEARRAQLGQAEEPEPTLNEYDQEPGLEHGHPWPPELVSLVYSGRNGERAERLETSRGSSNDMNALFPAPEAFERCQLAGHCSARGCLGKADLRVRQKLENSQPWPTPLSLHVVLDSCLEHDSLPRSFCLLRGSSTSSCLPRTLMKRHEALIARTMSSVLRATW